MFFQVKKWKLMAPLSSHVTLIYFCNKNGGVVINRVNKMK